MLQTLRGKQKYQITNVHVEKIKLTKFNVNHHSNPDRLDSNRTDSPA